MEIIGHRGCDQDAGENTLSAIKAALNNKADGIEIDLRKVGQSIIALHDDTVDRTTNGTGHYKSFGIDSIKSLICKNGNNIPLLDDILSISRPIDKLILELKEPRMEDDILEILKNKAKQISGESKKNIIVSSFDTGISENLSRHLDAWELAILYRKNFSSALQRAKNLGASYLHAPIKDVTKDKVKFAHAHNIEVYAFTVNHRREYNHCLNSGIDGIFTDKPEIFIGLN